MNKEAKRQTGRGLSPPRPGPTLPPIGDKTLEVTLPDNPPKGSPGDDEETFVGGVSKDKLGADEDSIDVALRELEGDGT